MNKSSQKVPLSVIIISDRDDERMRQAVESAQFADEVIVITTQKPIQDFAAERNKALERAKNEWVFFLDSDEVITSESVSSIKQLVMRPQLAGVWVRRRDVFLGRTLRWGEVRDVKLLRLAKKSRLSYQRPVHEVAAVEGPTVVSRITLQHFSHQSCQEFLTTVAKYARQEALYRYENGQRFSWMQLVLFPLAKWWQNAVFRLGFLDGWRGMTYVTCMTVHSLLVRMYLYELETTHS